MAYDSGVACSGSWPELIRVTALWFQCPLPLAARPCLVKRTPTGITRGIREIREQRLVQFNFTLIYSLSGFNQVARFSL